MFRGGAPGPGGEAPVLTPLVIRPLRDAVVAALVVFVISSLGIGVTAVFARAEQLEAVRRELQEVALIAATRVDVAAHRRIKAPTDEGGADYRAVVDPLITVQQAAADVRSLYTAVLIAGRLHFVADTEPETPPPGRPSTHVHVLQPYSGGDADLRLAAETQAPLANARPTTDAEGTLLSAYAPLVDASGRFAGVVGADMDVRDYEARVARVTQITLVALAAVAALSMLTGAAVLRYRLASAAGQARTRQLFTALAAAREAAEQSARAKATFVAMMSHELRTPLTAIIGYAELMRETLVASGRDVLARDVQRVECAGRQLAAIISDILDYSKVEAGRLALAAEPIHVPAAVEAAVEAVRADATAKGLALHADARAAWVAADPLRLQQVLRNLAGNAVKFTDRGRVCVRARLAGGDPARVAITVHDTGVGIAAAKRPLLFQPFSQVDGSLTRRAGGTGLGLVLSLRLVEAMGGTLRVRSREGRGSSVRVVLPAAPAPARQAAA